MPLCVLGPEIKLNNQCHTAVCMVPNIFQHDHPTNSPDGRCKAYYLEGSFSMLQSDFWTQSDPGLQSEGSNPIQPQRSHMTIYDNI